MTAPKLTPRKEPQQGRARATVDAILGAAEQLTRREGIEWWTTNHVAERAGVSIGSLYQYFPSKESLVTALYLHRRAAHLALLAPALAALGDPDVDGAAAERAVARAWLGHGAAEVDWRFDLALRDHLVAVGAARKLGGADEQARQLVRQVLARRGLDVAAAARRAQVVVRAIDAAIAELARAQPAALAEPALVDDIAALVAALRG